MKDVLGFTVEKRPSQITGGGDGVVVTSGVIPADTIAAVYPGLTYSPWEPILLQSISNQFVFRCIDNIHVDGNDRGLSRYLYRSCAQRDRVGPYWLCDTSWLTNCPVNPLAIGQYVNNHTKQSPANVAYQEIDITEDFPFRLRCFVPNTCYGSSLDKSATSKTRCVVLVSLRNIEEGEELLSSYFTLVQAAQD
ncbi:SET domain-containing protein 9 [Lamellibrachia satsuma]|nr:SET domain-containing protein 9 [Lamellibrachia satsuma]